MEPFSALVTIIAAGAASALSETAGQAVRDAYAGVRAILAHRLKSFAGLETAPQDEAKKKAVADELKSNSAANDDPSVLERIKVLEAALRADSQKSVQGTGFTVEDLNAAHDVLIKDVKYGQFFKVQRVTSKEGKIEISGISGGAETTKN